jgi:hypothetical protein
LLSSCVEVLIRGLTSAISEIGSSTVGSSLTMSPGIGGSNNLHQWMELLTGGTRLVNTVEGDAP